MSFTPDCQTTAAERSTDAPHLARRSRQRVAYFVPRRPGRGTRISDITLRIPQPFALAEPDPVMFIPHTADFAHSSER